MTERKKINKKVKSLIRFHSDNKIGTMGAGGGERIYRTSQKIRIKNVFLEALLLESFLSLGVTVHLYSLGCPSNTVLIS